MNQLNECYDMFGISDCATLEEIKSLYKELCREWHPDLNIGVDTTEMMSKINRAYEIIIDNYTNPLIETKTIIEPKQKPKPNYLFTIQKEIDIRIDKKLKRKERIKERKSIEKEEKTKQKK